MDTQNLTVVFTDMEGFTDRTSGLSRDNLDILLAMHDRITAEAVKEYGGTIVKNLGDGYMITFQSPTNAILGAKKIQQDIAVHNTGVPETEQFWVRIAANSGEVSIKDGDVFGEPVNVAARLMAQTEAGDISFTEAVYLAMNKTEIPTAPAGMKVLRGVPEAVKVYRVPRIGEKAITRGSAAVALALTQSKKQTLMKRAGMGLAAAGVLAAILYIGAMRMGNFPGSQAEAQSDILGVEESTGSAEPTNALTNLFNRIRGITPTPTTRSTTGGTSTGGTNTGGSITGGGTGGGSNGGNTTGSTNTALTLTPTPCPPGSGNCRRLTPTATPAPAAPTPTCPEGQYWNGSKCKDAQAPAPTNTPAPAPTNTPAPVTPTCPEGQEWRGNECKPIDTGGGNPNGGNLNNVNPNAGGIN